MWKGFSLSSQPLIHNSLFGSENWTAKCYWGIFYVMTIAGENHSDLKAKQTKTKPPCSVQLYLWDASRRCPWTHAVCIFGPFRALGWSLEGSASTVWPGPPNTHEVCPNPLTRGARASIKESRTMDSGWQPRRSTSVSRKEWRRTWLFRFRRTSRCRVTASALRVNKRRLWITDASSMP